MESSNLRVVGPGPYLSAVISIHCVNQERLTADSGLSICLTVLQAYSKSITKY